MSTPIRPIDGEPGADKPDSTRTTPGPAGRINQSNQDGDTEGATTSDGSAAYRTGTDGQSTPVVPDRAAIVARQKERFGGIKFGSAFFGWLTATGMAVLLIALLAAAGVAFGVATDTS